MGWSDAPPPQKKMKTHQLSEYLYAVPANPGPGSGLAVSAHPTLHPAVSFLAGDLNIIIRFYP